MKIFKVPLFLFITFISCFIGRCFSFGASEPVNYCKEGSVTGGACQSDVKVYVDRLTSEENLFPHKYNDFNFCAANDPLSLGLFQVRYEEAKLSLSPYEISFMENVNCAQLCQKTYDFKSIYDVKSLGMLREGILKQYKHHWIVDSIPVTQCEKIDSEQVCSTGFPMGCYIHPDGLPDEACIKKPLFRNPDTFYLFNHVDISITYHTGEDESWGIDLKDKGGRIISVKVQPRSISNKNWNNYCSVGSHPLEIPKDLKADTFTINYTYSVTFIKDNTVKWSSRWDNIMKSIPSFNVQWSMLSIPFATVLFLTVIVVCIFFLTLCKKKNHFNQVVSTIDKVLEDCKPASADDVFRPPQRKLLFSVLVGSGVQIFLTSLLILLFAWIGYPPFAERGALLKYTMVLYALLGSVAGYVSSRMYKGFGGIPIKWKANILLTATLCPGFICALFLLVNFIFWNKEVYSIPEFSCFGISILSWYAVSTLQTLLGAYFGFKGKGANPKLPAETGETSKEIPVCTIYLQYLFGIILGSVVPFFCLLYQLYLVLYSICNSDLYYTVQSSVLVFVMVVITCADVAIINCYFLLRSGVYQWWWHSFITTASSGCLVLSYCIFFYFTKTNILDDLSTFLYFGCSLLLVFLYTLMTGSIGFCASYWFVKRLYGERKFISLPNWRKLAFAVHLGGNEKINPEIFINSKKNNYHVLQNECE